MNNSEKIMVSICCIAYNHEQYIEQALDSFLMQKTNFKYEIIIHDDLSTDSTTSIIQKYEQMYPDIIKPIYQKENQYSKGIIVSQFAYKKARGKYITVCEGDDYWSDENKLQKQFDFLEEHKEYIATSHWCEVVNKEGFPSEEYPNKYRVFNFKKHNYQLKDYKKNEIPGHINTLMFRNIYLDSKYDFSKIYYASRLVGDRTAYLILALNGNIYVMHEFMSCYRFVVENNGTNYCSKVKDKNQFYDWYKYYTNLENAVQDVMNKTVSLKALKYEAFVNAIIKYIKSPNNENKNILNKIYKETNKVENLYCLPVAIVNRIIKFIESKIFS
ncbi:glycosyltransferase family 2 protein [Paraclostridium bifermentans]|uniref:glycosyltransferase family 2 protein n=1 Tax=Paraclostridium bifermentans TaxID=1490 RepID=UPI002907F8F1|nr:glycosyltransferase [Paraclostridium bifermentans]MDU3335659.1 glycosyltransferase [Paraclostridium bifermentans]